mmetsp:Transcript_20254/g.54075  ORF Transcript_20254/g.54075 Transcript_20254/m.54075 type:complete len:86 (-) Transcript_20254:53-310(-)
MEGRTECPSSCASFFGTDANQTWILCAVSSTKSEYCEMQHVTSPVSCKVEIHVDEMRGTLGANTTAPVVSGGEVPTSPQWPRDEF